MDRINWTRISQHALFWLAYLPINASLVCIIQQIDIYQNIGQGIIAELMLLPAKMALTYYIFYFIIPRYLDRTKVIRLVLFIALGFIGAIFLYRIMDSYVYLPLFFGGATAPAFSTTNVILALFDIFITVTAATTVKMIRVFYAKAEFEKELMREKLQSELDFLRAQTNPHFLFNTLNNLYGLARKKSEKTPDAIMKLSKILRFMLYDCRSHRIPLVNEAKVIRDYIELEKLRYNERLVVHYEETIDHSGTLIAPLLLLPFVENSFKHGAHSSTDNAAINIKLKLHQQQLDFYIENTFDRSDKNSSGNEVGGIGMRNQKRQLELLYPDKHQLDINDEGGWFRAHLHIDLTDIPDAA